MNFQKRWAGKRAKIMEDGAAAVSKKDAKILMTLSL